jgi:hypothetical protein
MDEPPIACTLSPFLTFRLERGDECLALEITGLRDARPVIAQLFA